MLIYFCNQLYNTACLISYYLKCALLFVRLAKIKPPITSAPLIICINVIFSPNISTASMLLKMGIRFPKRAVRAAPNFPMAEFQKRKDKTELPSPRYRMTIIKEGPQMIGGAIVVSNKKAGNNKRVPRAKVANKKLRGEIPGGFFRTRIL